MSNYKIKQNVLKYFIMPIFMLTLLCLVGCSAANNNTFKTLSMNLNTLIEDVGNIEIIENSTLIIDDFMDENNLKQRDEIPVLYEQTDVMYNYLTRLTLLNNIIYNTVELNNTLNNAKRHVIARAHQTKSLSDQCLAEKCKLSKNSLDSLKEINSSIMKINSRLYLTKNEIKNTLISINSIKQDYNDNYDKLSSRYEKLQSGLNARLIHLDSISKNLDAMSNILLSDTDCTACENYSCCDDNSIKTSKEIKSNQQSTKSKIKKNIDTYENAGTDFNGIFRNNPYYNQDNYLNGYYGYYRNMPNNYYGMGYGNMYGYGMPFGYGMSPFGFNGGGYMYPNINTFGSYKNIDTYKVPKVYKDTNKSTNNQPDNIESNYENGDEILVETQAPTPHESPLQRPTPKPMPIPKKKNDNKTERENIIDNPYIRPVRPEDAIYTDDNKNTDQNKDIMTLPLFDEDAKVNDNSDGEDTFVVLNPEKPTIEKLDK